MGVNKANVRVVRDERLSSYQNLSLIDLVWRIINSSDRSALREFHDRRPVFRLRGSRPMLVVQFVEKLCDSAWAQKLTGRNDAVLELACDLTIDKFSLIPDDDRIAGNRQCNGPDCRNYFRAPWKRIAKLAVDHPDTLPLTRELTAARIFQGYVIRHFRFSCMEAKRSVNPTRSRYAWRLDGKVLYLWMPVTLSGSRRRKWLEAHVENPDLQRPGERYRIQDIIDRQLGIARHVSIDEASDHLSAGFKAETPLELLIEREISAEGLARVVADEKAENIHKQRPAVGALGRSVLRRLILRIFEDLGGDNYAEGRLAATFGLSKATFSRFAGSRWQSVDRIPDLWANTAHILAGHATFTDTARHAGVLQQVQEVLQDGPGPRTGRSDNA